MESVQGRFLRGVSVQRRSENHGSMPGVRISAYVRRVFFNVKGG